jgi:carboxyl-terminal processing protease
VPQAVETFDAAWTIIRDTHFDKTMNGLDWNAVRAELEPRAAAAKSESELRGIIRDMLGRLGLSHFALIPSSADGGSDGGTRADAAGTADPGFDVRLVGRDLIVTKVERESPVRPGWKILKIESSTAAEILKALPEGANERLLNVEAWRAAEVRLRGIPGSKVSVTFENGQGAPIALALERRPEEGEPVTVGNLPTMHVRVEKQKKTTPGGRSVGMIGFNVWMATVDAKFQEAMDEFRGSDGIIIDLRGNPGGLAAMLMGISGQFVNERKSLGVMKTRDSELKFTANPRIVSAQGQRVQPYAGPVAILVDAMSGSASECFTGGMQSIGRARVFGQVSMGQALPALFDRLPNGDVLIHAYGDFVTANGTRLEGRGVIPDEIVPLRREDLLAAKDRTLDAALAWFDTAAGRPPQRP